MAPTIPTIPHSHSSNLHRSSSLTGGPHHPRNIPGGPGPAPARAHPWLLNQGFNSSSPNLNPTLSKTKPLGHHYHHPHHPHHRKQEWMTEEWVGQQAMYYVPREEDAAVTPILVPRHHHAEERQHRSGSVPRREEPSHPAGIRIRGAGWESMIYQHEREAERWMRHEAESRRMAEKRYRAQLRAEGSSWRNAESMYQRRQEFQPRVPFGIHSKVQGDQKQKPAGLDGGKVAVRWKKYEAEWAKIASSSEPLTFKNLPWPTINAPGNIEELTLPAIGNFLFSSHHSQEASRKDRLRNAQLRWHPDRFRRLMSRVSEEEKSKVEEGAGVVARVLNDLMEREKRKGSK